MKKSIFLLFLFFCFNSNAQFEFKADLSEEKISSVSNSFVIGNTIYYYGGYEITAVNLETGGTNRVDLENLEGNFFNKENLKNSNYFFTHSSARNNNENLQLLYQITTKRKDIFVVRVELNANLKLVSEEILVSSKTDFIGSQKKFVTNPKSGVSVFVEYIKKNNDPDFMRVIFFNDKMELVSDNVFSLDVTYKNNYGYYGVQLNSLFAVSENKALLNINNAIYSIDGEEFIQLDLNVKMSIENYLIRPIDKNGFCIVGFFRESGKENKEDVYGFVVLDFDSDLMQRSEDYVVISNNIFASCQQVINSDYSKNNGGSIEINEFFVDKNGSIRIIASPRQIKNNLGSFQSENLSMITLDENRALVNFHTVPSANSWYRASHNAENSIKVIFLDSPKCFDETGNYIPGNSKQVSSEDGVLTIIEFDKETGGLISRKILDFSNKDLKIKGTLAAITKIDGIKNSVILNVSRYGKNEHFIGKLK